MLRPPESLPPEFVDQWLDETCEFVSYPCFEEGEALMFHSCTPIFGEASTYARSMVELLDASDDVGDAMHWKPEELTEEEIDWILGVTHGDVPQD